MKKEILKVILKAVAYALTSLAAVVGFQSF